MPRLDAPLPRPDRPAGIAGRPEPRGQRWGRPRAVPTGAVSVPVTAPPDCFRSAFCARYRRSDSDFERAIFWRALHRHAVPLALLLRWISPGFFQPDTEFIRWLAGARNLADAHGDLANFEYKNHVAPHWLRTGFSIRLSASRIEALARECLPA